MAGEARCAAVEGGLSSSNSLRETEGKTSRGRSAVIGLQTDLKGRVGAAAVTAAQPARPSERAACALPPRRPPPGLPRGAGAGRGAVEARGGSAEPLTRALAHTQKYTCILSTHKCPLTRARSHNTQKLTSARLHTTLTLIQTRIHIHTNTQTTHTHTHSNICTQQLRHRKLCIHIYTKSVQSYTKPYTNTQHNYTHPNTHIHIHKPHTHIHPNTHTS